VRYGYIGDPPTKDAFFDLGIRKGFHFAQCAQLAIVCRSEQKLRVASDFLFQTL
jgi:hypothetical protein